MAVLGLNPILTGMLVVLFVVISVMMMLVVLIQRPSGGGLSGAFGSASEGAGQTAFGAKTGDALTTATIVAFLLFLGCAVGLNFALQPPAEVPAQATSNPAEEAPAQPPATGTEPGTGLGTEQQPIDLTAPRQDTTPPPDTTPEPAPADPQPENPQ